MRSAGILMHITSLPSPCGIGTLGKAAYDFADFLHEAGQHYWQILPIGPTGFGNSPYQSVSTHAGNPYLIDLDLLVGEGLLTADELKEIDWLETPQVDYDFQYSVRFDLLHKAFLRGQDRFAEEIRTFRRENPWVDHYALYMAIKRARNMDSWEKWPREIRLRQPGAVETYATVYAEDMNFFIFQQFLFFRQWNALRSYLRQKNIELIGDLPIYVPYDSCDVWVNSDLFQLDENGTPTAVAGCPPDAFSVDGQLWGNPLYDWEKMQKDDFSWWRERIIAASKLFDVIRIDHFRGLESYWSVPYGETTARNGAWVKGPDHAFIDCLKRHFPDLRLIAEDLGFLTPEVIQLQKDSGFPGMKILEFAFDPYTPSSYLPHRYERNCICYTGTHDNETLHQWLRGCNDVTLAYIADYLGLPNTSEEALACGLICAGMRSVADTFIAQMQDYLALGAEARMNAPGIVGPENWAWRMEKNALTPELAQKLRNMTKRYERTAS
ncbi:MAG: 4-alpha-glucanotransferase [Ruminococcaceae bacterium]|nr:4-alpha-glucanotransferase [Oscillospiraceae bacterium]